MEEKQALLFKEPNSQGRGRIYPNNADDDQGSSSNGSDEWWEESHSSCSSCCESHSASSFEWEAEISEDGQLFYIESDIVETTEAGACEEDRKPNEANAEENPDKVENVKGGRLVNWMRRRDGRKVQVKTSDNHERSSQSPSQMTSTTKQGSEDKSDAFKQIILRVDSVGQGSTLCEKLLGLSISSTPQKKAIVSNIRLDAPLKNCKDLSVGDILHGINNYSVTPQNLDNILGALNFPSEIVLKIQKTQQSEPTPNVKYQSNLVKSLLEKNEAIDGILLAQPVGIVVVDVESQNLNKDDVIYSYPEKCVLSSCRGAFVTLYHLLAEITPNNKCKSSSVIMKKQPTHVLYKSESNFLMLISVPQIKCSLKEATYIMEDLVRNLLFNHQTLKKCFESSEKSDLDRFFSLFFSRLLTNGFSSNASRFVAMEQISTMSLEPGESQFEDILPYATWVPLPKEAQIQIDDALNELEANDFEHEDEDSIDNQRLFNIIGSCLFHKGYLLASHLPKEDLLDVYSFYRQNCLIQLFRNEPVKSLVIWREVYPQSVNRGLPCRKPPSYPIPTGRWFLLIVGQGYDSLAVILEAGGCCMKIEGNPGPVVEYVEEAEDTLKHMQKLGVSSLASQWIENNSRFKTITPEEVFAKKVNRKKENLLGFVKSFDPPLKSSGGSSGTVPVPLPGPSASPSGSKSSDSNPGQKLRVQIDASEDSVSQSASNTSELSDENAPILGRRAERSRAVTEQASDSDSSDSDWDSSRDSNMRESTCSSGAENFYLGDVGEVIPAILTTGPENLLFHYIHLDGNEGVLVNPPANSKRTTPKMKDILDNFRRCAQIIHSILENNIRFKKNGQDSSKCFINKSLVAVKEHGVLFECISSESDSNKKPISFTYWIVGRLFFTPQPREVYVCYYEDAPQNLVEIAFRLGLSAAG